MIPMPPDSTSSVATRTGARLIFMKRRAGASVVVSPLGKQLSDWRKGEFQPLRQLQSKAVQNRRICGLAWLILFSTLLE